MNGEGITQLDLNDINKSNGILTDLNSEQLQAVTHKSGPLLIIAGAGTGKTKVITTKIAWLINQKICQPSEILALTFTDKAATEMESRVDELVPYGFVDMWISTFHSFGDRILRDHAIEAGLPSDFRVLSSPEQVLFFRDHLFEFNLNTFRPAGDPTRHINDILSFFSRLKDEDLSPDQFLEIAKTLGEEEGKEKYLELAYAYKKYQELMIQNAFIDFGDQTVLVLKLFREHKDILSKYQKKFKYILVDEYQDTNYAQNQLVSLLSTKENNITVVGDDDQSIYRFRGAAISNILEFKKTYPQSRKIVLKNNYRSTKQILEAAYRLIQHNNPDRLEVKEKIDKKLVSSFKGGKPLLVTADDVASEADYVAQSIQKRINEDPQLKFSDIAILVRANSHAISFIRSLNYYGIPYIFSGSAGLYTRPEIRLILCFIQALTDEQDNLSLYHLATSEIYKIKPSELIPFFSYARHHHQSLKSVLKKVVDREGEWEEAPSDLKKRTGTLVNDLDRFLDLSVSQSAGNIIYSFLQEKDVFRKLIEEGKGESETQVANIAHFFQNVVKRFEDTSEDNSIIKFSQDLKLLIESGENPSLAQREKGGNAVNILTVHSAKGLEFEVVYLVSLTSDRFPSRERNEKIPLPDKAIKETLPEGDSHLQEERRLFYVGLTRAKKVLYLTWSKNYGGVREKKISPFILEALDSEQEEKVQLSDKPENYLNNFNSEEEKELVKKAFYTDGHKIHLNPHQIDDYLDCPLKFKFTNILRIPTIPQHNIAFGIAIHKSIEYYFSQKIGKKPISLDDMIEVFNKSWQNSGFLSRQHIIDRHQKGKDILKKFLLREEKRKRLPTSVEKRFVFNFENSVISGRFDCVYSDEEEVEIKDFKTTQVDSQEEATKKTESSRQLSIYALAWFETTSNIPYISLSFIDSGFESKIKKQIKNLENTRQEIRKVIKGIEKGDFQAKPSWNACDYCGYYSICPHTLTKDQHVD